MPVTKVFISYAREDQAVATRLYEDLRQAGFLPWIDIEDLLPGEEWRNAISRAIRESRFVLVLQSTRSVLKRGFVQKEIRLAIEVCDEFSESDVFLIPVRLDECIPDHPRLRDLNWVDLFPSYEQGFLRIVKGLRGITQHHFGDSQYLRCPHCGWVVSPPEEHCSFCGWFVGVPNVRRALEERSELERRYDYALSRSQLYEFEDDLRAFGRRVQASSAVISVSMELAVRLLMKNHQVLSGQKDSKLADTASAILFAGYSNNIIYGHLSLNGLPLKRYGNVGLVLNAAAIAKRATVLETSSFRFVERHLTAKSFPPGFLSTWADREMLAVAKIGSVVQHPIDQTELDRLLVREGQSATLDEFMEVQIYGPLDLNAIDFIVVASHQDRSTEEKVELVLLRELAEQRGKICNEAQ